MKLRRASGLTFGFANQALFLVTVWYLFWFLRDGSIQSSHGNWILVDTVLALVFAFAHSLMLAPKTRRVLSKWIPSAFYDSVFCVVTCVSLLVMFVGWRTSETTLWQATGQTAAFVRTAFYISWGALIYSLSLTGLGYQTGWTPFYHWLRQQPSPRREFKPRGAYKLFRHPVYLSFLGLVWFTPTMTLDHAVLTAIWTAYIFYGSFLKDRRLEFYIGEPYKYYQARVPGYPLFFWGPLGRRGAKSAEIIPEEPSSLPAAEPQREAA
ncbi:NnrU family protein [Rhodopirellula sp. MGV]|uniref:NnrU family protein n=1 Tax=Rhodopirellula sp. MGV TaxID=2023130 RepID=UPI0013042A85|nr:NnrU family protein [Rhodopirellula sp. MGV]